MPQSETPCPYCKGEGFIEIRDNHSSLCICTHVRQMRMHLGPDIAAAKKISSTPLYIRGDPPVDLTKENLLIQGAWRDLIPHFRYTLICKGLMFRFLVITDERIKNVFVGNEHAMAKSREERNDEHSFNSLSDVMGEYDLVLVRLGFLGHKNIAMPGALKESLMIREVASKPTWIIEEPDSPFVYGHRSYSDEVAGYINTHFRVLKLGGDSTSPVELRGFDLPDQAVVQQQQDYIAEQAQPEAEATPETIENSNLNDIESDSVVGGSDSWKKKKKPGYKRKSGGGPV